ncbi:RusA family crossover junction endodeoxyribonuclease [Holzapfeliella sp. He02]|uniref:RusA family crossover junction endodeoxyribonuclease n=1 Tax=Holzapfeliella saturejae TaxID=3082953 RepID=UPI0030EB5E6D
MPTAKPDVDNYFKGFTDALNGLVFEDDNQITEVHAYKFYSDNPRIELEVEEIE